MPTFQLPALRLRLPRPRWVPTLRGVRQCGRGVVLVESRTTAVAAESRTAVVAADLRSAAVICAP